MDQRINAKRVAWTSDDKERAARHVPTSMQLPHWRGSHFRPFPYLPREEKHRGTQVLWCACGEDEAPKSRANGDEKKKMKAPSLNIKGISSADQEQLPRTTKRRRSLWNPANKWTIAMWIQSLMSFDDYRCNLYQQKCILEDISRPGYYLQH